jgi:hypothetical protein
LRDWWRISLCITVSKFCDWKKNYNSKNTFSTDQAHWNCHHYLIKRNLKLFASYGVFFRSELFFLDNTRIIIFFFFCLAKRKIFFRNVTLGYMTKTLNQVIFIPPPKSEYFFSILEVKWSIPYQFLNLIEKYQNHS